MSSGKARLLHVAVVALAAALLPAPGATAFGGGSGRSGPASAAQASSNPSGGAPLGGLAPNHKRHKVPPPPSKHAHGTWLPGVTITEYWPAPESWFVGGLVSPPGLSGRHRIDWLYSAMGVSMAGDGIGLDGRRYHIDPLGDGRWVTR